VALRLKQSYRIFEDIEEDDLYVPPTDAVELSKDYFEFSRAELEAVCQELTLDTRVIDSICLYSR